MPSEIICTIATPQWHSPEPTMPFAPSTVGELLHWSYANVGMAHAAIKAGATRYERPHYMIRSRLYGGLRKAKMNLGSIAHDERLKMILPQVCCYCGTPENLSIDHLIPSAKGGADTGDNFVWSCRRCNSSKGARDVMEWLKSRQQQPSVLLARRFLKLAIAIAADSNAMDASLDAAPELPFAVSAVPTWFPLPESQLWIVSMNTVSASL